MDKQDEIRLGGVTENSNKSNKRFDIFRRAQQLGNAKRISIMTNGGKSGGQKFVLFQQILISRAERPRKKVIDAFKQ